MVPSWSNINLQKCPLSGVRNIFLGAEVVREVKRKDLSFQAFAFHSLG
jgi:hypothetical protein